MLKVLETQISSLEEREVGKDDKYQGHQEATELDVGARGLPLQSVFGKTWVA